MKRTPWYPVSIKPARPGIYECKVANGLINRREWSGRIWKNANGFQSVFDLFVAAKWRGLTKEHK